MKINLKHKPKATKKKAKRKPPLTDDSPIEISGGSPVTIHSKAFPDAGRGTEKHFKTDCRNHKVTTIDITKSE